jgi:hypothetical protein
LKILIWFLLFYLVFRLVKNIFAPVKVMHSNRQEPIHENYRRKEGNIIISDIPDGASKRRDKKDDDGEYIDYKEV